MKLSVFGGAGKTGRLLVAQALAVGHEITVLARAPAKLEIVDPRLRLVQGDALDPNRVEAVVAGADAIISLLGPAKDAPPLAVSRSTENIIWAAGRRGVRRLVVSASAGVGDPEDKPGLVDRVIIAALKTTARDAYDDMLATARLVRASDLDWTLVRALVLTDGPATGHPKVRHLGKGVGARLSRADLAAFMLGQATDRSYLHQAPVVSS